MYCILFLHQTTTVKRLRVAIDRCIASSFYIKPQLAHRAIGAFICCIASSFYIKPQLAVHAGVISAVVLHPLSTSNHNRASDANTYQWLYCILFLHQTTTERLGDYGAVALYCILFLHQTTTARAGIFPGAKLYCILFLHQTTTDALFDVADRRCIASSFYIKPQRLAGRSADAEGCIASSFYIKPQQTQRHLATLSVVLHPLSTSNHNHTAILFPKSVVVLHPLSTSNHNPRTPDTLIFGHLTASRHDTKRGGVHRGSRFDAVFTFSTNIRKIIFTEIRRCMSVQRAGARLRSDSSEANI